MKKIIPSLIFNIAETAIIILLGISLQIEIKYILLVMVTFLLSRGLFGNSLHFKTWYRCLIWSTLIMLSLFVILKIDLVLSIVFAIFSAFIMTGKSNIKDTYLWKNNGESSKYQDIIEYIKYNELDDKLIEFEEKIKKRSNVEYLIYKYRFKDHKTFNEISEMLEMENPRIVEHLDKVAFAMRIYLGI